MIRFVRVTHLLALVALSLLLAGCAAKVVTDYDRNAAFPSYQTWAFAPGAGEGYTSWTVAGSRRPSRGNWKPVSWTRSVSMWQTF